MNKKIFVGALQALLASTAVVFADVGHSGSDEFGKAGTLEMVNRVIEISMDVMDFGPEKIQVSEGETIRFVVTNVGRVIHEFNLGTRDTWKGHDKEMRMMFKKGMINKRRINHEKMEAAGMMHDDPNSVLLEPGKTGEVIWTFSEATEVGFACNVPGHRNAGMVGKVVFQ